MIIPPSNGRLQSLQVLSDEDRQALQVLTPEPVILPGDWRAKPIVCRLQGLGLVDVKWANAGAGPSRYAICLTRAGAEALGILN